MRTINRTTLFLTLTFVITYLLVGIYKLSGGDITNRIGFTVLGAIIMFMPSISVIIVYFGLIVPLFSVKPCHYNS